MMTGTETLVVKSLVKNEVDGTECVKLLWRVALRNHQTEVSHAAMNYLSEYYLRADGK
jgi:hypothetical protein